MILPARRRFSLYKSAGSPEADKDTGQKQKRCGQNRNIYKHLPSPDFSAAEIPRSEGRIKPKISGFPRT